MAWYHHRKIACRLFNVLRFTTCMYLASWRERSLLSHAKTNCRSEVMYCNVTCHFSRVHIKQFRVQMFRNASKQIATPTRWLRSFVSSKVSSFTLQRNLTRTFTLSTLIWDQPRTSYLERGSLLAIGRVYIVLWWTKAGPMSTIPPHKFQLHRVLSYLARSVLQHWIQWIGYSYYDHSEMITGRLRAGNSDLKHSLRPHT